MSKPAHILIIFAFLPFFTFSQSSLLPKPTTETFYKYILANSLKYNDPCTWENEQFRQEGSKELKKYPKDSTQQDQVFYKIVTSSVNGGRTFCNAADMLMCSKSAGKCVCGEPSAQISLGDRYKSSSYDMEQDPTTHKSICRWARGAACSPPPTTPQSSSLATQVAQCAKGSECVSTTDGTTCTGTTVSKFLTASIMRQETFDTFMDGMLMGKTCVCSDGKKSAKRTKRSSLEIHEEDARRISALL